LIFLYTAYLHITLHCITTNKCSEMGIALQKNLMLYWLRQSF